VLGYELLNEPWTGDVYSDASLILPGNAGHHLLEPFFNRASQAIRAVDNQTIIFWEPVTYAYLIQVLQIVSSLENKDNVNGHWHEEQQENCARLDRTKISYHLLLKGIVSRETCLTETIGVYCS
jgi:endoglycosylceramidase